MLLVITGEFITNLVRQWFWDEEKSYESCEELLFASLVSDKLTDEKRRILAQDIIEGRKKLAGDSDTGIFVEDDNENIRPLRLKLAEEEKKRKMAEIQLAIINHGIVYVDPYSTVKSIKSGKEMYVLDTAESCYLYFWYSEDDRKYYPLEKEPFPAVQKYTRAGLWLFEHPELIYEAEKTTKPGTFEFWDKIYELTKDIEALKERNNYYKFCIRRKKEDNAQFEKWLKDIVKKSEKNQSAEDQTPKSDSDFKTWSGLVSPEGVFYPCDFGEHEQTAYKLIKLTDVLKNKEERDTIVNSTKLDPNALHKLLSLGWIALRYLPSKGKYIDYNQDILWNPNKKQKEIVWNQCVRHEVDTSIVPSIFF